MENILAQRLAFYDFSQIVGFPNPLPDRDEWEDILPEFQEKNLEVPAEHLLDFHEVIHRLNIMHEDVQIKIFKYSLKGVALDWCRSLPTASIHSLTGFHTTFNSFCKDYFPAECLYENCCDEFSLLHKASVGPEDHVCDEAFTMEESICYENLEALDDINYVSPSTEASDIISDTSVLLDVHKDQHASCENSEFIEQMLSIVDGSPEYRVEADVPSSPAYDDEDLPVFKEEMVVEEDSSLFLQEVSHDIFLPRIKEKNLMYEQPEAAVTDVPEMDIFDSYILDGITILEVDHRNEGKPFFDEYSSDDEQQAYPTFDHYEDTDRHDNKQSFPMVPIYDDYESDPWESHGEEEEEPKMQFTECAEPVSEQPPPEISQPMSVVHPPMLTRDIQPHVNNCVAKEATCRPFSGVFHWSYEPVKEYMELYFLHKLEPPYFISTSACKEELKSVTILLSRLHHLFVIIDRRKELLFRKLLDWLWWKFSFT
jgi:hypothetical protein